MCFSVYLLAYNRLPYRPEYFCQHFLPYLVVLSIEYTLYSIQFRDSLQVIRSFLTSSSEIITVSEIHLIAWENPDKFVCSSFAVSSRQIQTQLRYNGVLEYQYIPATNFTVLKERSKVVYAFHCRSRRKQYVCIDDWFDITFAVLLQVFETRILFCLAYTLAVKNIVPFHFGIFFAPFRLSTEICCLEQQLFQTSRKLPPGAYLKLFGGLFRHFEYLFLIIFR